MSFSGSRSDRMLCDFYTHMQQMRFDEQDYNIRMIFIQKIREKNSDELRKFYTMFRHRLDPHYSSDEPFRIACATGDYQTVRFIYDEIGSVDHTARNHEAFHTSCFANYLDIATWFQSIDDRYHVVMRSDNTIDHTVCKFIVDALITKHESGNINNTPEHVAYQSESDYEIDGYDSP